MNSLSDLLFSVGGDSRRVAVEDETQALTLGGLRKMASAFANLFASIGISHGDRVLFVADNSTRYVAALFGALKVGAVVCPVHPGNGGYRVRHFMRDAGASCIVVDDGGVARVGPEALDVQIIGLDQMRLLSEGSPDCYVEEQDTEGLAAIIYTSGSTGLPLGVRVGHCQALFCVDSIASVLSLHRGDAILCGLPFSFDYGLFQIFLAFRAGARLVVRKGFPVPLSIPRDLFARRVTVFPAVPSLLALLLKSGLLERASLPDLRLITSTGDVLPSEHLLRLEKQLPGTSVLKMYGLTECKRVAIMPPGMGKGREDSVGKPLPGVGVRIEARKGQEAMAGAIGELVVSGPNVMDGYWNQPDATARRFALAPDGVPYLRTGDLFRQDEEGFLYFVARKGRLLKTQGHGVSPVEIENFLSTLPTVVEAAVVGLPCEERGTMVCAAITVDRRSKLDAVQVKKLCARELPDHCIPTRVLLSNTPLPKTVNGKINRKIVRSMVVEIE